MLREHTYTMIPKCHCNCDGMNCFFYKILSTQFQIKIGQDLLKKDSRFCLRSHGGKIVCNHFTNVICIYLRSFLISRFEGFFPFQIKFIYLSQVQLKNMANLSLRMLSVFLLAAFLLNISNYLFMRLYNQPYQARLNYLYPKTAR